MATDDVLDFGADLARLFSEPLLTDDAVDIALAFLNLHSKPITINDFNVDEAFRETEPSYKQASLALYSERSKRFGPSEKELAKIRRKLFGHDDL